MKIFVTADVTACITREVEVPDDIDFSTCDWGSLFWKDNDNLTGEEQQDIIRYASIDPWKIEDESGNELMSD